MMITQRSLFLIQFPNLFVFLIPFLLLDLLGLLLFEHVLIKLLSQIPRDLILAVCSHRPLCLFRYAAFMLAISHTIGLRLIWLCPYAHFAYNIRYCDFNG